jgi:hypothetical protein
MVIKENIAAIFSFDCYICSSQLIDLKEFMMNKHNWSEEQFNEYKNVYISTLCFNREDEKEFKLDYPNAYLSKDKAI